MVVDIVIVVVMIVDIVVVIVVDIDTAKEIHSKNRGTKSQWTKRSYW